jgi:hypothetical protein
LLTRSTVHAERTAAPPYARASREDAPLVVGPVVAVRNDPATWSPSTTMISSSNSTELWLHRLALPAPLDAAQDVDDALVSAVLSLGVEYEEALGQV